MSDIVQIRHLREMTGAGVVDVKNALDEAAGDEKKALVVLRKRGQDKALKKGTRETREGVIGVYVHSTGRVAALVKLYCETDFVARNAEFQALAHDLAMHVVALNPRFIRPEDVPEDSITAEREIWQAQLSAENKPADILERILTGKEKKFREENALLSQPFVKDGEKTVAMVVAEAVLKIGENIHVGGFVRYEM